MENISFIKSEKIATVLPILFCSASSSTWYSSAELWMWAVLLNFL